jgi:hypothetical protein
LSLIFGEQTFLEQFWIVKTFIDLLLRFASDAEETAIFVNFQRFKPALEVRYHNLIAPRGRRVVPSFTFGMPLFVPHSFNFPLYCFNGASRNKRRNFILSIRIGSVMVPSLFCAFLRSITVVKNTFRVNRTTPLSKNTFVRGPTKLNYLLNARRLIWLTFHPLRK